MEIIWIKIKQGQRKNMNGNDIAIGVFYGPQENVKT